MERLGDYVKRSVLDYKLNLCCYLASVRVGVLGFAILNAFICVIILVALAEAGFEPLLLQALKGMGGEEAEGTPFVHVCIIAYAVDLSSSVLLLCAIWRVDPILLKFYLYYACGVLLLAVMVYSVVFFTLVLGVKFFIIISIGYQCYLILLVRSAIVEIKRSLVKNGYIVNLKKNYGAPGPLTEKYKVVIETDGVNPPATSLVKKGATDEVITDIVAKAGREAILQHLAATARNDIEKAKSDKEITTINVATKTTKEGTTEVIPKKVTTQATTNVVATDVVTKDVATKDVTTKDVDTKNVAIQEVNEVKEKEVKKETKKPIRRFFGRKEKVKIEDSEAKLEKVEARKN